VRIPVLPEHSVHLEELGEALRKSKRQVSLPAAAPAKEYELTRELEPQLGRLHPAQIQLIRQALALAAG